MRRRRLKGWGTFHIMQRTTTLTNRSATPNIVFALHPDARISFSHFFVVSK